MNELSLPLWMQKYATRVNAELGDKIESEKYLSFPGKIEYSDNLPDIAAACEILLNIAETREELILGFDIEWPFDYKSGPGKTSLIQICPDKSVCYLFHVIKLTGLPRALILLLRNPKIKFVGLNVKNDFQKLGRDFRLDVNQIIKNSVIELSTLANEKLLCAEKWSLDRLVLNQLNLNLDKSIKVLNEQLVSLLFVKCPAHICCN